MGGDRVGRYRGGQTVRIDEVDARVGQSRSGDVERPPTDGNVRSVLQVRQVGQLKRLLERLLQVPRTGAQLIGLQLI